MNPPDIEPIVAAYLRDASSVETIVGDRVDLESPQSTAEPWVRVYQYDSKKAGQSSRFHLIAHYLQIDCFAGTNGTRGSAKKLAAAVATALDSLEGEHDGVVISGTEVEGIPRKRADFEKPMERYIVEATIWAHGVEEVGS